jgi:hypothetical protein
MGRAGRRTGMGDWRYAHPSRSLLNPIFSRHSVRALGPEFGLTLTATFCIELAREGWLAADDLTGLHECIRGSKDLVAQCPLLTRSETLLACRHSFQLGLTASRAH